MHLPKTKDSSAHTLPGCLTTLTHKKKTEITQSCIYNVGVGVQLPVPGIHYRGCAVN